MITLKYEKDLSKGIIIIGSLYIKCIWCDRCREFLNTKALEYSFIYADKKFFREIMDITKSNHVPQVIIDGEYIGGYEDLLDYYDE